MSAHLLRNRHHHRRAHVAVPVLVSGLLGLSALLGFSALSVFPARAAAAATRTVAYRGYRFVVPASWPVYRLTRTSSTCVRFDRHAVYLGRPGAAERCPATLAAGRTEAILVSPRGSRGAVASALPMVGVRGAEGAGGVGGVGGVGGGSAAQFVPRGSRVVVTATWRRQPRVIARALRVRSLASLAARSVRRRPRAPSARMHTFRRARDTSAPAAPGEIYTGPGFDACSTPSSSQMAAWGSSPYRALGVYIGGANMACAQPNLNATWVSAQSEAGWHLIPIYVGLQAPSNSCGCAAISPASASTQGAAAANDAVADAQAIGIGAGNPLYFDMEAYGRTTTNTSAVLAFLSGWTSQLHADGYASGVYVGDNSGAVDLVSQYGNGYPEPDDLWAANWNGQESTDDANVPATEWANHQRLHQYDGAHNETYSGTTINIDGDYIDAGTAAAGTGTGVAAVPAPPPAPTLSIATGADGTVTVSPSWPYATGVSSWQLMGGQSQSSLAPLGSPTATTPIVSTDSFNYFAVSAVAANGQILGSSAPVATPKHVAIFGRSVFVPARGLAGIPVGCFNTGPCWITATVALGNSLMARTGHERVPAGGGLVYFKLNGYDHKLINRARHHQLAVTIRIQDASGVSAVRPMTLSGFYTSGPSPRRSMSKSALHLIGTSDFVSHAWVGGILAGCFDSVTCQASTKLVAAGRVIARTHAQPLGVNELGYLMFTLTRAGHTMLRHAPGNQLSASVTITTGRRTERGQIVLSSY